LTFFRPISQILVFANYYYYFFFFWWWLGFELKAYFLNHSNQSFFCVVFFQDRVSTTICPGWLQTAILLISDTWVARRTGVNHWCPACFCKFLKKNQTIYCTLVVPTTRKVKAVRSHSPGVWGQPKQQKGKKKNL
jgi:hypothetical protein